MAQQLAAPREMSSVPSSPTFGVADDASSVLRAAAADAAEARRLAQMARQTSELVLRQAAQARYTRRTFAPARLHLGTLHSSCIAREACNA